MIATRLWKEFRLVGLYGAVFLVLVWIYLFTGGIERDWDSEPIKFFVMLCGALLGAAPLGAEMAHRTMPCLLAQPLQRNRIWTEKTLWLWAFLGVAALPMLVPAIGSAFPDFKSSWEWGGNRFFMHLVMVLSVVLGANFWTLVTGLGLGGAVMSLFATFFIVIPLSIPYEDFIVNHPLLGTNLDVWQQRSLLLDYRLVSMGLYLGTILIVGPRIFRKYEATGGSRELLGTASSGFERLRSRFLQAGAHPTLNLIRKELSLHQVSFLLALGICNLWLLLLGYLNVSDLLRADPNTLWMLPTFAIDRHPIGYFLAPTAVYLVLIPILIGASSVAEEKALGTLVMNLTIPSRRSWQWRVKCGVALGTSFVLGVLLPFVMGLLAEPIRNVLLLKGEAIKSLEDSMPPLLMSLGVIGANFTVTSIAIWASTIGQNTLRAAGLSLGMTASLMVWIAVSASMAERLSASMDHYFVSYTENFDFSFRVAVTVGWLLSFVLAVSSAYLFLGYRRYKDMDSDFRLQALGIAGVFIFILMAFMSFFLLAG